MDYGLSSDDISSIKNVFAANPKVHEVILFGSRAMGNYKAGSDIDLAILAGPGKLDFNDLLELHAALENLGLLYSFDLQNFKEIRDPDVLDHIRRVGKVFFQRNAEA